MFARRNRSLVHMCICAYVHTCIVHIHTRFRISYSPYLTQVGKNTPESPQYANTRVYKRSSGHVSLLFLRCLPLCLPRSFALFSPSVSHLFVVRHLGLRTSSASCFRSWARDQFSGALSLSARVHKETLGYAPRIWPSSENAGRWHDNGPTSNGLRQTKNSVGFVRGTAAPSSLPLLFLFSVVSTLSNSKSKLS